MILAALLIAAVLNVTPGAVCSAEKCVAAEKVGGKIQFEKEGAGAPPPSEGSSVWISSDGREVVSLRSVWSARQIQIPKPTVSVELTSDHEADAFEGDLRERLQTSVDAGTGGPMAEYALCYIHAVLEFADGHQTPELVTDADVWEDVLVQRREIPFEDPIFERERSQYWTYHTAFRNKSHELALQIANARDPGPFQQQSKKLSTEATKESLRLATASLADIRKALPGVQEEAFMRFIEARRGLTVVVRLDYTKINQKWGDCR